VVVFPQQQPGFEGVDPQAHAARVVAVQERRVLAGLNSARAGKNPFGPGRRLRIVGW
jgi:hypothetical protein